MLAAAVAGYAFDAIDIMVIALTLPLLLKEWGITMVQGGTIVTAMLIGNSIGGFAFGPIAEKFGRKKALIACITFFALTTGLAGFSQNYYQLAALRFLAGLGLGAEWALGATMVAEFFPLEKRGRASSWMQGGWPIGFGLAVVAQYFLVPAYGWRALYFVGATGVFVALYIAFFVPESPMWLKAQAARNQGVTATSAAPKQSMLDLLRGPNLRAFALSCFILSCALCAYWAVNSWLPTVLAKEKGMATKAMSSFLLVLNLTSIPVYFVAGFVADKLGKRNVIIASAIGSALTLYFWLSYTWAGALFWIWGMAAWATASFFWSVLGVYIAEQYPTHVRALGLSSSFSVGRIVSICIPVVLGAVAMKTSLVVVMGMAAAFYFLSGIGCFILKESRAHM